MADKQQTMAVFDVPRIFAVVDGSPTAMLHLIALHNGVAPQLSAVQMWSIRRSIAGNWIGAVLYALICEGHDPADFLRDPIRAPAGD